MNSSKVSQALKAGVIAASLAIVPVVLPASAQTNTTTTSPDTTYTAPTQDVNTAEDDRDFDWGWLGLLGLAGLAGLARKRQEPARTYTTERDPDVARSDYR